MIERLLDKLWQPRAAFDHPVTVGITIAVVVLLALTPLLIEALSRRGAVGADLRAELYRRYRTWLVLTALILGPVLLGAGCTILAVAVLSFLCFGEFARSTGLHRHRALCFTIVVGILALTFAELDHWYGLFVALTSLTIAMIAVVALFPDRPEGYIQRVALSSFAFLLFGVCLGHLAYIANDALYRPIMLTILVGVEMNDVFAYITGRAFGRRRLAPNTSPNKTVGGAIGALILTTCLFVVLGHFTFRGTQLDTALHLLVMGILVSIAGQFGDLVISSIKRDLGVKDMGASLPGHGGLLDRFDSLLLVAPAIFHYIGYVRGFGLDQPLRILSNPWP